MPQHSLSTPNPLNGLHVEGACTATVGCVPAPAKALVMSVTPVVDGGVLRETAGPVVALAVVDADVVVEGRFVAAPEQAAAKNTTTTDIASHRVVVRGWRSFVTFAITF
jgi:hypothetical protein